MRQIETPQSGIFNGMLQLLILKLGHLATLCTDLVMMSIAIITFLVLRRGAELVLDDQPGIDKQDNGIVEGGAADAEILLVGHQRIKRIDVEMPVDGIDGIEYGVTFGCLAMPVRIEIFGEYLSDRIFHILTFHIGVQLLTAYKVKPFLLKASDNRIFFFRNYREKERIDFLK